MDPGARLVVLSLLCALSGCASASWLFGPAEDSPPEAPNARVLRFLTPSAREEVFPPPRRFEPRDWLERVVCGLGESPGWKRTYRRGLVERYEIECPGASLVDVELDTAAEPPPAPAPCRLLDPVGVDHYREALEAIGRKDARAALTALDEARRADPAEKLYRRERAYVLYVLDRIPEALVASDEVLEEGPDPLAYKYRALAARSLGMHDEVVKSLDGILSLCPPAHPLHAEALCAKGIFTLPVDVPEGQRLMELGCGLGHKACCEFLQKRREERDRSDVAPVSKPDGDGQGS